MGTSLSIGKYWKIYKCGSCGKLELLTNESK